MKYFAVSNKLIYLHRISKKKPDKNSGNYL